MAANKKLKSTLFGILLFISFHGSAAELMSASCSEPAGVRYDKEDGKIMRNDDGFSGVKPQFIYSKNNPSKITVLWPDSKTLGSSAKPQTHEATIVDSNESMITAIALYEHRINLYTLCNGLVLRDTFLEVIINFKRCKNEQSKKSIHNRI